VAPPENLRQRAVDALAEIRRMREAPNIPPERMAEFIEHERKLQAFVDAHPTRGGAQIPGEFSAEELRALDSAEALIGRPKVPPIAAGEAQRGATTADVEVRPPSIGGGATGPPLTDTGHAVDIDLWRAVERGNITGEGAQDVLRRIGDMADSVPGLRNAADVIAGPASSAGADTTVRAGVVYRMVENLQDNERAFRLSSLDGSFPFKVERQGVVRLANGQRGPMADVAEDFLSGGGKFTLNAEEQDWIRQGKKLIDDVAAQYGGQTGTSIEKRGPIYWPRVVQDAEGRTGFRLSVGAKQTPFKARIIEEMQAGVDAGVNYADPLTTLEHYVKSVQKATRDDVLREVILADDIGHIAELALTNPSAVDSARIVMFNPVRPMLAEMASTS